ncbi:MAG: hypothetical protein R3B09_20185 [Nannocystaceae bacterium]
MTGQTRGPDRAQDHTRQIASLIDQGYTFRAISIEVGLSLGVVKKRADTIRALLAEHTGDGSWLIKGEKTNVQAARAFLDAGLGA